MSPVRFQVTPGWLTYAGLLSIRGDRLHVEFQRSLMEMFTGRIRVAEIPLDRVTEMTLKAGLPRQVFGACLLKVRADDLTSVSDLPWMQQGTLSFGIPRADVPAAEAIVEAHRARRAGAGPGPAWTAAPPLPFPEPSAKG